MKTKFLGASAIIGDHRRSTCRIKKFCFPQHIGDDAASQQFHMRTEHRMGSPIIADDNHLMKTRLYNNNDNNQFIESWRFIAMYNKEPKTTQANPSQLLKPIKIYNIYIVKR